MLNLLLALVWLLASAASFFFYDHGQATGSLPLPLSGLFLVMVLYNLVRWWSARALRRSSSALQEPRRRPLRRPGDDAVPDPTFDFRDRPEPTRDGESGRPNPPAPLP